jgi:hypothetical protein
MVYLSVYFLLGLILLGMCCVSGAADDVTASRGRVYIVLAIDTESSRPDPWAYSQSPGLDCFLEKSNNPQIAKAMDKDWRNRYRDSNGNCPKFTWFIMSHEVFRHTPDGNCGIVYEALQKYREPIKAFGDEFGWHYHHADWYDLNGDGQSCWNQLTTFDGTEYTNGTDIEIAENSLNCLLVNYGFFPGAFRSGWVWEDNDFSRWLEEIIPFDFSCYPPNQGNRSASEPARNQYDWSRAPQTYSGYHPDFQDYQKPGRMRRWVFRSIAPNNRRQWERIFRAANSEGNQILCYAGHSYDNLQKDIDEFLPEVLRMSDSLGIPVVFATASEAGASISGHESSSQLELDIDREGDSIMIQANKPVFQKKPYCVLVKATGLYERIRPRSCGVNRWSYNLPPDSGIRIICAASALDNDRTIVKYGE